jgi:uncharacterized cupin superfamily protein
MKEPVIEVDVDTRLEPCRTIDPGKLLDGDPVEGIKEMARSADGRLTIGVWTCTPERDRIDEFPVDEFCHVVEGVVELTDEAGARQRFGPGSSFFVPRGFKGVWRTVEPVKKIYVIYEGTP